MITSAEFRVNFSEFADVTAFPSSSVDFWLRLAYKLLRPERWMDILDDGAQLFTAHNLALERVAQNSSDADGVPGMAGTGVVASKQVDKLSISYDTSVGVIADAGHWNLTSFGMRFLWLMKMAGTGGTQYGAGPAYGNAAAVFGGVLGLGWPYG